MAVDDSALAPSDPLRTDALSDEPKPAAQHARGPLARVGRMATTLLRAHATHARREALGDKDRLLGGAVLAVVGVLLLAMTVTLLHGAAVAALQARRVPLVYALLVVALGDLLGALAMLLAARARFSKPVLPETRRLLGDTIQSLLED